MNGRASKEGSLSTSPKYKHQKIQANLERQGSDLHPNPLITWKTTQLTWTFNQPGECEVWIREFNQIAAYLPPTGHSTNLGNAKSRSESSTKLQPTYPQLDIQPTWGMRSLDQRVQPNCLSQAGKDRKPPHWSRKSC